MAIPAGRRPVVIVVATLAILVFGLVVAATILLVTGRAKNPKITGPVAFGIARDIRRDGQGRRPVRVRRQQRRRRVLDRDRERQARRARRSRSPGTKDCNVIWKGSKNTFVDCNGDPIKMSQLARYPITIPTKGKHEGRPARGPQQDHPGARPVLTSLTSSAPGQTACSGRRTSRGDRRRNCVQLHERRPRRGRRGRDAVSPRAPRCPDPRWRSPRSSRCSVRWCSAARWRTRSARSSNVPQDQVVAVIGAGVSGALVWNLFSWWRGLPSSSTHALIGGLVGAAVVADGTDAVGWKHRRPRARRARGVTRARLRRPASSARACRGSRSGARRARSAGRSPSGQWISSAGARVRPRRERRGKGDRRHRGHARRDAALDRDDARRSGSRCWPPSRSPLGTCVGGWKIVRTVGMGIFRIRPLDGLVSQTGSALVVVGASVDRRAGEHEPGGGVVGRRRRAAVSTGTTCTGRSCGRSGSRGW